MGFGDVVAMVSVTLGLPYIIMHFIKDMRRMKYEQQARVHAGGRADEALSLNELQSVVKDAVHEAIRPLERRVATLERQVGPPAATPLLDLDVPEPVDEDSVRPSTRSRARS